MISDLEAAQLCKATYLPPIATYRSPVGLDPPIALEAQGVVARLSYRGNSTVIAFRGSVDKLDWTRDFNEFPVEHPVLGHVHAGFLDGVIEFYHQLGPLLKGDIELTGHSLGGAHACLVAGLLTADAGRPPKRLALFGCPRPGFARLEGIVSRSGAFLTSYRNGSDPVPTVGWLLGLYKHVIEPANCMFKPPDGADPFAWHSIDLYVQAMQAMESVLVPPVPRNGAPA